MQVNIFTKDLNGNVELNTFEGGVGVTFETGPRGKRAGEDPEGIFFAIEPNAEALDTFAAYLEGCAGLVRHAKEHLPQAEQGQGQTQGQPYVHDNVYDEAKCQEGDYSDLQTRTIAHDHRTGFTRG